MKRTRTIMILAAGAAAALLPLLPQSASAADQTLVVFTAGASIGDKLYAPGLGPDVVQSTYQFDTEKAGLGGQKACVAVNSRLGADAACKLQSIGSFGAAFGVGANCAWSRGAGDVTRITINGENIVPYVGTTPNLKVTWPVSSGSVLPFVLTTGANFPDGTIVGNGAVQVTGTRPGTCGVGDATTEFEVSGFAAGSY